MTLDGGGAVDTREDSPYTAPDWARSFACYKAEVVKIQALRLDPLEFHRVVPANEGTHAVFVFCGRAEHVTTNRGARAPDEIEVLQHGE